MKKRFASLRLTKAFYITLSYKQFRRLARSMRRKKGAYEHNYLLSLECRLMSYLYRTSLLTNPFYCMKFIKKGHVLIDLKCQNHYNFKVPIYKMITFSDEGKKMLYKTVKVRLKDKKSYFNLPKFINMSYFFLFNYIIKPPVKGDLVYPIPMDFYRATGYAF
jgi:ribosomal protein S4